jgi:glutamine synthetase
MEILKLDSHPELILQQIEKFLKQHHAKLVVGAKKEFFLIIRGQQYKICNVKFLEDVNELPRSYDEDRIVVECI